MSTLTAANESSSTKRASNVFQSLFKVLVAEKNMEAEVTQVSARNVYLCLARVQQPIGVRPNELIVIPTNPLTHWPLEDFTLILGR